MSYSENRFPPPITSGAGPRVKPEGKLFPRHALAHPGRPRNSRRAAGYGRSYYGGVWYGTGRHYWNGQWYDYGVGPCWLWSPIGYVWTCS